VDVIPVIAVLHKINFANCYQNGSQKARKEAKEGREGKKSSHNRKEEGNCADI
jgi:ABC-type enterochelin transport system ATPase subunit